MSIQTISKEMMSSAKTVLSIIEKACETKELADVLEPEGEAGMVMDMLTGPDAFMQEIANNHGVDSVQYAWASVQVKELHASLVAK